MKFFTAFVSRTSSSYFFLFWRTSTRCLCTLLFFLYDYGSSTRCCTFFFFFFFFFFFVFFVFSSWLLTFRGASRQRRRARGCARVTWVRALTHRVAFKLPLCMYVSVVIPSFLLYILSFLSRVLFSLPSYHHVLRRVFFLSSSPVLFYLVFDHTSRSFLPMRKIHIRFFRGCWLSPILVAPTVASFLQTKRALFDDDANRGQLAPLLEPLGNRERLF